MPCITVPMPIRNISMSAPPTSTTGILQAESDLKKSLSKRDYRLQALTDFGTEISMQKSLKLNDVYRLAYKYTEKVMSTSNMYIALLDEKMQEISFPCFYQKISDDAEVKAIYIPPRSFNKNSDKKGRTEDILSTGKEILIKTKEESIRWYQQPGHEEKIGDPFASWVGVPIISRGLNVGVITLYHASKDYLYDELDILFLKSISFFISDLLVRLELEKMQGDIAEKEALLSSSLIAQDVTYRVNNALGSFSANLSEIAENIEKATILRDVDVLQSTREKLLPDAITIIDDLLNDVDLVACQQPQDIDIKELIPKLIRQIKFEKNLDKVLVRYNFSNKELFVKALYRNLLNCLHAIIENAATAICEKMLSNFHVGRLYIAMSASRRGDFIDIELTDNGLPVPEDVKSSVFESIDIRFSSEFSDKRSYGLWRSRILAKSLGGDLFLIKSDDETKVFRLSIPASLNP